jgi:putative transposase
VDIAQYHGISVPEFEFLPDQPSDMVTTSESKDTLADEKAREVWKDSSLLLRTDST